MKDLSTHRHLSLTSWGLIGMLLIPTTVFMFMRTSSMTAGLVLAQVVWLALIVVMRRGMLMLGMQRGVFGSVVLVVVAIAGWSAMSGLLFGHIDVSRLVGSLGILMFSYFSACIVATALARVPGAELKRVLSIEFQIMVVFAILVIVGAPTLRPGMFEKPVILFTEKSHFALAFAPLLIFAIATSRGNLRWIILSIGATIALGLQNVTALAGVLIAAFLVLSRRNVLFVAALTVVLVVFLNTNYYAQRLDLSSSSENLSALVFLSGWERAMLNFQETWGLGVGFQQFGVSGSLGEFMALVEVIVQETLNLNDGGSTASKLIGELGVVGLVALVAYVAAFTRALFTLRAFALSATLSMRTSIHDVFWNTFIVAAALDLFIRGMGYFSVGLYMLLVALIGKARSRRRTAVPQSPIPRELHPST